MEEALLQQPVHFMLLIFIARFMLLVLIKLTLTNFTLLLAIVHLCSLPGVLIVPPLHHWSKVLPKLMPCVGKLSIV